MKKFREQNFSPFSMEILTFYKALVAETLPHFQRHLKQGVF